MTEFLQMLVSSIPREILAVAVGSLLTLLGVRMQLHYAERERGRDRTMQLKRDVFLEASEAIAGSALSLMRLANLSIPISQLGDTGPPLHPGWDNKILLVAGMNTIAALSRLDAAIATSNFELTRQRMGIDALDREIASIQTQINQQNEFQQMLYRQVTAVPITQAQERAAELLPLQKLMDDSIKSAAQLTEQLTPRLEAQVTQHQDLWDRAMRHFVHNRKLVRIAMIALRNEMGYAINAAAFEQIASAIDSEVSANVIGLINDIATDKINPFPQPNTGEIDGAHAATPSQRN